MSPLRYVRKREITICHFLLFTIYLHRILCALCVVVLSRSLSARLLLDLREWWTAESLFSYFMRTYVHQFISGEAKHSFWFNIEILERQHRALIHIQPKFFMFHFKLYNQQFDYDFYDSINLNFCFFSRNWVLNNNNFFLVFYDCWYME